MGKSIWVALLTTLLVALAAGNAMADTYNEDFSEDTPWADIDGDWQITGGQMTCSDANWDTYRTVSPKWIEEDSVITFDAEVDSSAEEESWNCFGVIVKWIDNTQHPGDILDLYIHGDTAPGGRFRYRYVSGAAE